MKPAKMHCPKDRKLMPTPRDHTKPYQVGEWVIWADSPEDAQRAWKLATNKVGTIDGWDWPSSFYHGQEAVDAALAIEAPEAVEVDP